MAISGRFSQARMQSQSSAVAASLCEAGRGGV
jgi:hypothetical protein